MKPSRLLKLRYSYQCHRPLTAPAVDTPPPSAPPAVLPLHRMPTMTRSSPTRTVTMRAENCDTQHLTHHNKSSHWMMIREEDSGRGLSEGALLQRRPTIGLPLSAPQASAVTNANDDLKLTDELLRSLIEGKSFQTTPIHTYPVHQRSHFQSPSRACNASR